jgi:2-polyprenyl-3-methyl-5-hydroxy-6-metoxy-1,4-benzoquinol methylase
MYKEINFNLLKDTFDKKWLRQVSDLYVEHVGERSNNYFTNQGLYLRRWEQDSISKKDVLYFDCLLYPPLYAVLDYILKNYDFFKNKKIIDNGCGFGILSVFLNKINIPCFNYDTLEQLFINDLYNDFLEKINKKFNSKINLIQTDFKDIKFDVVINSGAPLNHPQLMSCGLYLLDSRKQPGTVDINYKIIERYRPLVIKSNYLKP